MLVKLKIRNNLLAAIILLTTGWFFREGSAAPNCDIKTPLHDEKNLAVRPHLRGSGCVLHNFQSQSQLADSGIAAADYHKWNSGGILDFCRLSYYAKVGPVDEETGNFKILEILKKMTDAKVPNPFASFQFNGNLPFAGILSKKYFTTPDPSTSNATTPAPANKNSSSTDGNSTGPSVPPQIPDNGAPNPYFVEVTGISVKGTLLHNWLHFRVFMNHSVTDETKDALHTNKEKRHHATGVISAMFMMIKDQDGWPIGDFSKEMPCHKSCAKYTPPTYYGDYRNALPCSYTPPWATSHPGMFVYDADPNFYEKPPVKTDPDDIIVNDSADSSGSNSTGTNATSTAANSTKANETKPDDSPPSTENPFPKEYRRDGSREVHATWSFDQTSCNFVTEIHIQTLIFEEFYDPDSKQSDGRFYGWTAQYNILYTKGKSSLGAADYVNINYWKQREKSVSEIDCHVPLFDHPDVVENNFTKGAVPINILQNPDNMASILTATKIPSKTHYMASLWSENPNKAKLKTYLGTYDLAKYENLRKAKPCRDPSLLNSDPVAETNLRSMTTRSDKTGTWSISQYMKGNKGVHCPCPALPTELSIASRTANPETLHGRLVHASHMGIAYMFLTPLACYVARYYKETFVTVFCFQEYWWYMWHVVLLIISCMFIVGAILSLHRTADRQELEVTINLRVHQILGGMSIAVFFIEVFTGFFRRENPVKRLHQIFMHWLIGNMNILCAVGSMFAMVFQQDSGMNCGAVYTLFAWVFFIVLWYAIMDVAMKNSDKKMNLKPPRSYLPPPVVRLLNRDARGRNFRMVMLAVYIINLVIVQGCMSYYMWLAADGERATCYDEWKLYFESRPHLSGDTGVDADPGGGDDDYD